ncbi:hypothetical protein SAMN05216498_3199, partial [Tenuibacillus multivorans]
TAEIELVSGTPPLTFAFVRVVVTMQVSPKIKPEGLSERKYNTDKSILSIRTAGAPLPQPPNTKNRALRSMASSKAVAEPKVV